MPATTILGENPTTVIPVFVKTSPQRSISLSLLNAARKASGPPDQPLDGDDGCLNGSTTATTRATKAKEYESMAYCEITSVSQSVISRSRPALTPPPARSPARNYLRPPLVQPKQQDYDRPPLVHTQALAFVELEILTLAKLLPPQRKLRHRSSGTLVRLVVIIQEVERIDSASHCVLGHVGESRAAALRR